MPDLGKKIADIAIKELTETGEAFWDNINTEQRPIVERAVRRLATVQMELMTMDDDMNDIRKIEIDAIKGTLLDETTLASIQAWNRVYDSIMRAGTATLTILRTAAGI